MNWVKDRSPVITSVDTHISNTYYPGLNSRADGIDLRIEINRILYGTATENPKGHWVIYRSFDRTQKSQYWKESTKEGVGGPAYEWTDSLIKVRRKLRNSDNEPLKAGEDNRDVYQYYLEHNVSPKRGDYIYELDWDDHTQTPNVATVDLVEKYRIIATNAYRLEFGRIEYWRIDTEYEEIKY